MEANSQVHELFPFLKYNKKLEMLEMYRKNSKIWDT